MGYFIFITSYSQTGCFFDYKFAVFRRDILNGSLLGAICNRCETFLKAQFNLQSSSRFLFTFLFSASYLNRSATTFILKRENIIAA
jgi:hypothetical protein